MSTTRVFHTLPAWGVSAHGAPQRMLAGWTGVPTGAGQNDPTSKARAGIVGGFPAPSQTDGVGGGKQL